MTAIDAKTGAGHPTTEPIIGPVTGHVQVWLRLEGFSAFVLAIFLYGHQHASWVLFALLFLVPDLSMLGYMAGPRAGAATYNAVHSYLLPLLLVPLALVGHRPAVLPYALIWIAHIGLDRALGFGLKYGSGFGHTHLGWLGKKDR
jgi:hypothetical protein